MIDVPPLTMPAPPPNELYPRLLNAGWDRVTVEQTREDSWLYSWQITTSLQYDGEPIMFEDRDHTYLWRITGSREHPGDILILEPPPDIEHYRATPLFDDKSMFMASALYGETEDDDPEHAVEVLERFGLTIRRMLLRRTVNLITED